MNLPPPSYWLAAAFWLLGGYPFFHMLRWQGVKRVHIAFVAIWPLVVLIMLACWLIGRCFHIARRQDGR